MNIAILGMGTVGRGVYDLAIAHPDLTVVAVFDRNAHKTADLACPAVADWQELLANPSIDVVVELLGGFDPATTILRQALQQGKHVVTANKAVISRDGQELIALAQQQGRHLRYEAAVGAATIVLDPLSLMAHAQSLHRIDGIVNGATNSVLTMMDHQGLAWSDALDVAYRSGYLEQGTSDDMDGLDAMRKLHILSNLAFQGVLGEHGIDVEPLSHVSPAMHEWVRHNGWTLKYLVRSKRSNHHVEACVHPVVLDKNDARARVNNEWNAITIHGDHHKAQTFIGQGAGRYPTATAVLYDLMVVRHRPPCFPASTKRLLTTNEMSRDRYLIETPNGIQTTEPMTIAALRARSEVQSFARWDVASPVLSFEGISVVKGPHL